MKKSLLALFLIGSAALNAQTFCSELFISEVVEGSGNNKAMEIYNPTSSAISLSNYRIVRYSNGSPTGTDSVNLTGTIASLDVWVVANGQTVSQPNSPACDTILQGIADQLGGAYPDPMYQNGNDAMLLVRISPYAIVDIFGKIGEDPGQAWTDVFPYTSGQGAWWTKDHSLQRKPTVTGGVTTNPSAFNVQAEYDSLPQDNWSDLGQHDCNCSFVGITSIDNGNVSMNVFPNPTDGQATINASENITRIEVLNTLGEVVFVKEYKTGDQQSSQRIDLSNMPGGMYMVQVQVVGGNTLTYNIIVR
jgi:hypothetical protein